VRSWAISCLFRSRTHGANVPSTAMRRSIRSARHSPGDREAVGSESAGVERIRAVLKHDSKAPSSFDEGAAGIIASQLNACLVAAVVTLIEACLKIPPSDIKRWYTSNSQPLHRMLGLEPS
jgi:hypothetical protein